LSHCKCGTLPPRENKLEDTKKKKKKKREEEKVTKECAKEKVAALFFLQ
jgi:hypothetical protein